MPDGKTLFPPLKLLTCALCGKETRSVYSLPGDRKAKFCASCFFGRAA